MALALALLTAGAAPTADRWRTFEGSWTVTGRAQTVPTGGARPAAIVQLSGSVVLTDLEGLGRGFRGEAIAYTDGDSLGVGRAVWTDQDGDRIYSVLAGDMIEAGRLITGTISGGTGRYAGLVGGFEFVWQYALEAEDGAWQGRAADLKGRVRGGGGAP